MLETTCAQAINREVPEFMTRYNISVVLCFFVLLSIWAVPSFGIDMINEVPLVEPEPYDVSTLSLLTDREFILSMIAILFGLVVLIIEYKLLSRAKAESDQVLKVLIVSTIVIATMFIISAGYSSEKIAPAIGLFGTIAGYLLGRSEKQLSVQQSDKETS